MEIQDTGIGISQETMDELFSPFKQAQRLAGGTGLGLYSLAKRMETLNGYYGVRARADGKQGSNFWFAIPYKPDHISAAASIENESSSSSRKEGIIPSMSQLTLSTVDRTFASSPHFSDTRASSGYGGQYTVDHNYSMWKSLDNDTRSYSQSIPYNLASNISVDTLKLNILLVDDSFSILKVVGCMLQKQGHIVTEALNGEEALRILNKIRNEKETTPLMLLLLI